MKIPNIITKTGDKGSTSMYSGEIVPKTSLRMIAIGKIDSFSSFLGLCHVLCDAKTLETIINIQKRLTLLMGEIATSPKEIIKFYDKKEAICNRDVEYLEEAAEFLRNSLNDAGYKLKPWIIYGQEGHASAQFDAARAICRETEISVWQVVEAEGVRTILAQYLNRLSDYLFLLGRFSSINS